MTLFVKKDEVTKQVNILLALKEEYKKATGQDWKPTEANTVTPVKKFNSILIK